MKRNKKALIRISCDVFPLSHSTTSPSLQHQFYPQSQFHQPLNRLHTYIHATFNTSGESTQYTPQLNIETIELIPRIQDIRNEIKGIEFSFLILYVPTNIRKAQVLYLPPQTSETTRNNNNEFLYDLMEQNSHSLCFFNPPQF